MNPSGKTKHVEAHEYARKSEAAPKCQWRIDDDWQEDTVYKTTCGHSHMFTAGDIADNSYKFCPYCGLAIEES
jgi:hypothetical protein